MQFNAEVSNRLEPHPAPMISSKMSTTIIVRVISMELTFQFKNIKKKTHILKDVGW